MNVLIIEDEPLAAERIIGLLESYDKDVNVVGVAESITQALDLLDKSTPDLILSDIELSDGLSFKIFESKKVVCPIIFTTAYEAYALRAFKLNSIDYLLKPINKDELSKALDSVALNKKEDKTESIDPSLLRQVADLLQKKYKTRFMVRLNDKLIPILAADIQFFKSEHKVTWAHLTNGKKYPLDETMDQTESFIDPHQFFRVNRSFIINIVAIDQLISFSNSRYKIVLKKSIEEDIIVARDRVGSLKSWLADN